MIASWRPGAIRELQKLGFDGTVLIPEDRPSADGKVHFKGDYDDQVGWERDALQRATVILAYVPRDLEVMPAFTTNVEWGMWWDSGKIVFGAPPWARKNTYLKWYALCGGVPIADSIEGTAAAAVELLTRFDGGSETCAFCTIIRHDPNRQD